MKQKTESQEQMFIKFIKSIPKYDLKADFLREGNKETIILSDLEIYFSFRNGEFIDAQKIENNENLKRYYIKRNDKKE